jgi:leucyl-tRNA synthetase
MKYDPKKIEKKWQERWLEEKVYEPDLDARSVNRRKPFYNLMMFPYPSAEGLHVGNMYAFAGADIYGRMKRMQGHDVFEPIGLDGFGIHSENYALKIGTHPADQAKVSEKRFYEQLKSIGNGFAWDEHLETYDPEYYRWTQWIFVTMWKHGLAYRKKQAVNWCPKDQTVLADEQVEGGKCERCGAEVIKKELEQWFFKITDYAERLLRNLEGLDWSEKVKIAQKNWIGKSEGASIEFPVALNKNTNFLILHGYTGLPTKNFIPWLKKRLEGQGYKVQAPEMPNTKNPKEEEQVDYVLENCRIDENTILIGHSLGGIVAMKVLQKVNHLIAGLVLVAPAIDPTFSEVDTVDKPFWKTFSWNFDYDQIKKLAPTRTILSDLQEKQRITYLEFLGKKLDAKLITGVAAREHFCATEEPIILENVSQKIKVFTTRPDTLFGATFMVISPELAKKWMDAGWRAPKEVGEYVGKSLKTRELDRTDETREKTGVATGVYAVNPANKEEIPVWVADYVLGSYGTGAIMAVPAHDERDFEFAKKFKLPIRKVIHPVLRQKSEIAGAIGIEESEIAIEGELWDGDGELLNSGKFGGMESEKAKWEITEFVGGEKKIQFRLRDWLISRQRYWGPPIPMVHCEACAAKGVGERADMPGWYAVTESDLPVRLPYIKNFRPTGSGTSPLAAEKSFYETKCPKCGGAARRETDVSDTFLDSAWYYLRYLDAANKETAINKKRAEAWLPVHMYTGGAEHAVLHLLYVRFVAMALHDWGFVKFEEPFKKFRAHGLLIKDGAKMSKSKGNVINPDEYIKNFGADTLRMYLMFLAPFEQGGDFRDSGVLGIERFLKRVWGYAAAQNISENKTTAPLLHKTTKKISEDIENLHYNTAVSALMILLRAFEEGGGPKASFETFLKLLAPFAPHMTEEIWREVLGHTTSIHLEKWPEYDPKLLIEEKFELVIQVNGKVRDTVEVEANITEERAKELALQNERIRSFLGSKEPKKLIYVPKKLVNIVL